MIAKPAEPAVASLTTVRRGVGFARRHVGILAVLALFGGLYLSTLDSFGMLMWDEAHYATLGRGLMRGEGYTDVSSGTAEKLRPPVVPVAVAASIVAAKVVAGDSRPDRVAKFPTLVFALLCLIVVYRTVSVEAGRSVGAGAAFLLGIFPAYWTATANILTEIPFMAFYTAAVVSFHHGLYRDERGFLLAWPMWSLALLTRYTALLFGPTVVLLVLVPFLFGDREAIRRLRSWSFYVGPCLGAMIVAPWFGRSWFHFGDPFAGMLQAAGQIPAFGEHGHMPAHYYFGIIPQMLGSLPALLLVLAAVILVVERSRFGATCFVAVAVIVGWMSQYPWKEPRLITGALPFMAMAIALGGSLVGKGLGAFWPSDKGSVGEAALAVAGIAILAVAFTANYQSSVPTLLGSSPLGYPSFRRAMQFLAKETAANAVVLGPNCYQIAWYSDRRCRWLPEKEKLAGELRETDWVVITNFERGQPAYAHDELTRLNEADFQTGRARVYRDKRYWTAVVAADLLLPREGS